MALRQLPYLLVLALTLCALPANAQDWTGKGRAQGVVKDDNGQPLAGVLIRMRQPGVPEDGAGPESTETSRPPGDSTPYSTQAFSLPYEAPHAQLPLSIDRSR